jgi:HEAT repeat protein
MDSRDTAGVQRVETRVDEARAGARAAAELWPQEWGQFGRMLSSARRGAGRPAILVGGQGRGKSWLLTTLVQDAREQGDIGLHVHLDRYFDPAGFAARVSSRLVEVNGLDLTATGLDVPTQAANLGALMEAADLLARQGDRALVLGLSGWHSVLDAPPGRELFDYVASLLRLGRSSWHNSLIIVELRADVSSPELSDLARSGLVHFPLGALPDRLIERVLGDYGREMMPFSPSVRGLAADRAKGNLHLLKAALRSVAARARAAGIQEIGPVEWEALAGRPVLSEIADGAPEDLEALLTALVDWPAPGYIPLVELARRMVLEGSIRQPGELVEQLQRLGTEAVVLGLEPVGDPPWLRFEWPELRSQLAQTVHRGGRESLTERRALQALILQARDRAESGDFPAALTALALVLDRATEAAQISFRRQAAGLLGEIWGGAVECDVQARADTAPLLVRALGEGAVSLLIPGLSAPEKELRDAAKDGLALIGAPAAGAVAALLSSDEHALRLRALWLLGRLPCDTSLDAVLAVLDEPDTDLRLAGLQALGELHDLRAGDSVARLAQGSDAPVRAAALRCIASLGYSGAMETVTEALADVSDEVRVAATEALAALGDDAALPALLAALQDERSNVRDASGRALAMFEDRGRRALVQALGAEDARVRHAAALGCRFFPARQAVPMVVECLRDPERPVVEAALEALVLHGAESVETLAHLLADPEPGVRQDAATALARIGEPAAPALEGRLGARSAAARAAAADALGRMRRVASVAKIATLLSDEDPQVRLAAVEALSTIGSADVLPPIVEALADEAAEVAEAAAAVVAAWGAGVVPVLVGQLGSEKPGLQRAVMDALLVQGKVAEPALLEALGGEVESAQAAALRVLTALNSEATASSALRMLARPEPVASAARDYVTTHAQWCLLGLVELMGSERQEVRAAAIATSVAIGAVALPALTGALQAGNVEARIGSASALMQIGDAAALPALLGATGDDSEGVRAIAVTASCSFGSDEALCTAALRLTDQSPLVQQAASDALCAAGPRGLSQVIAAYSLHERAPSESLVHALKAMGEAGATAAEHLTSHGEALERAGAINCLIAVEHRAAARLLRSLLEAPDQIVVSAAIRLAAAFPEEALPGALMALGEGPQLAERAGRCLASMGRPALDALIELVSDASDGRRLAALRVLAILRAPAALEAIVALLGDADGATRQEARNAVGAYAVAALPVLMVHLDDESTLRRHAVAELVARLGDAAVPALITCIESDPAPRQAAALGVLRAIGTTSGLELAASLIAGDQDVAVESAAYLLEHPAESLPALRRGLAAEGGLQSATIALLGRIGAPATTMLAEALIADPVPARLGALQALSLIGGENAVTAVTLAVADEEPGVRSAAAVAAVRLRQLSLAAGRLTDPDPEVRRVAGQALLNYGPEGIAAALDQYPSADDEPQPELVQSILAFGDAGREAVASRLADPDPAHRACAIRLMACFGGPESYLDMAPLLGDPDADVRRVAYATMMASTESVPALVLWATSEESRAATIAGDCLVEMGAPAVPVLYEAADDRATPLRGAAIRLLARVDAAGLGEHLDVWLRNNDEGVRVAAADCIADMGRIQSLDLLLDGIDGDTEASREARLAAVCSFGEAAVGPLLERMEDPAWADSAMLARALANLGEYVEEAVLAMLEDELPSRRLLAVRTLGDMRLERAASSICLLACDESEAVREAAIEALRAMPAACAEPLFGLLATDDAERAGHVVGAIAGQPEETLDLAVSRLDDADYRVRAGLVRALGRAVRPQDFDAIRARLQDAHGAVRMAAARALTRTHTAAAAEALLDRLDEQDDQVRACLIASLRGVGERGHGAIVERLVGADGAVNADVAEVLGLPGSDGLEVVRHVLDHDGPRHRAAATRALGKFGEKCDADTLAELLSDEQEVVRQAACAGLCALGEMATGVLMEVLKRDAAPASDLAAEALGAMGPQAAGVLRQAMADATDGFRARLLKLLVQADPTAAREEALALLGDDASRVRLAAAEALLQVGDATCAEGLAQSLDDPDEHALQTKLAATAQLGDAAVESVLAALAECEWAPDCGPATALSMLGPVAEQRCAEMLGAEAAHRRWMGARGLQALGSTEHVGALAALAADGVPEVRQAAISALRGAGDAGAAALLEHLPTPDADLRARYAAAVVELGEHAVDAAVALQTHESHLTRLGVLTVINLVGGSQYTAAVAELLADPRPVVRLSACEVAGNLGGPAAARALVDVLQDPDADVAQAAHRALRSLHADGARAITERLLGQEQPSPALVQALGMLGAEAVATVQSALSDDESQTRARAVALCGMMASPELVEPAAQLLKDEQPQVRDAAVQALKSFGAAAVGPAHRLLLSGEEPGARSAREALELIGLPAVSALAAGLERGVTAGRVAAIQALCTIGDTSVAPAIAARLADDDPQVRTSAVLAVQRFRYAEAIPALLEGLDGEPGAERDARLAALVSFGMVGAQAAARRLLTAQEPQATTLREVLALMGEVGTAAAMETVASADPQVRARGSWLIAQLGLPNAATRLCELISDPDADVRDNAARALASLGPAAAEHLLERLATVPRSERAYVVAAVARQDDAILDRVAESLGVDSPGAAAALEVLALAHRPQDATRLVEMVRNGAGEVRAAGCRALVQFGTADAAEALVEALHDQDEDVSDMALEALREMGEVAYEALVPRLVLPGGELDEKIVQAMSAGGTAAAPILRDCLHRDAPNVRSSAVAALVSVAGEAALPDAVPLLDDADPTVRQATVSALSGLGRPAVTPALQLLTRATPEGALAAADLLAQLEGVTFEDVHPLLRDSAGGTRHAATRLLGALDDDRATAHLVVRLKDPDVEVRTEAVRGLGRRGSVAAIPHLVSALDDEEPAVSRAAVEAFGQIGAPAIDGLITRLLTVDGTIREEVVFALAGIGPAAVDALVAAADSGTSAARCGALRALSLVGGPIAGRRLVEALTDSAPDVRAEAARGTRVVGRDAVGELVRRLADPELTMTEPIVAALGDLREVALPEVVRLFESRDEEVRELAAEVLSRMGMAAAPVLRKTIRHASESVRALSARSVARIGDVSMVPDLIEMLEDQDTGVVSEAIRALADLGDERAVGPVVRCVGAASPAVRDALAYAMPKLGDAAAEPLADLLTSDDPPTLEQAIGALRRMGRGAEKALVKRLNSELPGLRMAAARVMSSLGTSAVIEPLVAHLDDPDDRVRRTVAEALGALGGPAVAPVLDRLTDSDPRVNDAVLASLRAMSVDPIYTLMERARDADERMRLAAVKMAGRYGREEAIATLQQRLHDTSLEINQAAAVALSQIGTEPAVTVLAEASVGARPELGGAVIELLHAHATTAVPVLVRLAARQQGDPDPRYAAVATEIARSAPGVLDRLLADSEEPVRRAAAVVLGDIGDSQSLKALVRKARDPDAPVRQAAAVALGRMGSEALRPLAGLLSDPDPDVMRSAADVLATMGTEGASLLARHLASGRNQALQVAVCHALRHSAAPEAVTTLLNTVRQTTDSRVRVAAASSLAQLGNPDGTLALEHALAGTDEVARAAAAEALATLGGGHALSLVSLVDDDNAQVRDAATRSFRHLQAADVPKMLHLGQHPDAGVRAAVATSLRQVPQDPEALQLLLTLLRDPDDDVSQAAVESLSLFGDAAFSALSLAGQSADPDERYAACWALGQLGPRAVDVLLPLADDPMPEVRADAIRALGRIGDLRGRGPVLKAVSDLVPKVRVAAVGALRRLATEQDAAAVASALADEDPNVRMVATSVVPSIMTDALRQAIIALLGHSSSDVRGAAAQALRQDGHHSALAPLRRAASRESEPWVAELMESAAETIAAQG